MNFSKKKKIDIHTHYLPEAYRKALLECGEKNPDGFPTPTWNPEEHLEAMESLNITTSMLSLSSPHFNFGDRNATKALARNVNEYGTELVRKYPGRFGLLASMPLPDVESSIEEIRYAMDILHVDGFTLPTNTQGVYLGNKCLDPIFEELNKYKSVVFIHPNKPGSVPANVTEGLPIPMMEFFFDTTRTVTNMILEGTITRFSDIKFVIPHAGAFLPILGDRLAAAIKMMPSTFNSNIKINSVDVYSDLRKLYYDVAGVCLPRQLPAMMQLADADHFLYGSDYPYTFIQACIKLEEVLDKTDLLTEKQHQCINYASALKLFPRLSQCKNGNRKN